MNIIISKGYSTIINTPEGSYSRIIQTSSLIKCFKNPILVFEEHAQGNPEWGVESGKMSSNIITITKKNKLTIIVQIIVAKCNV